MTPERENANLKKATASQKRGTRSKQQLSGQKVSKELNKAEDATANNQSAIESPPAIQRNHLWPAAKASFHFLAYFASPVSVAVFTGLIYAITADQWAVTNDQLGEMRKSTEQVEKSLGILREQTALAKQTLVSSQRAFIASMSASFSGDFVYGKPLRLAVNYQNTGREPARNVKWKGRLQKVSGSPQNPNSAMGTNNSTLCQQARDQISNAIIYPSDTPTYQLTNEQTFESPIGDILEGTSTLYYEGCLSYETFGERKESRFCFFWMNQEAVNLAKWEFRFCPNGNDGT